MTKHNRTNGIRISNSFYNFPNPLVNFLLSKTRMRMLNAIYSGVDKSSLIIDFGCLFGDFTRVLSMLAQTIGLDIDKNVIAVAKKSVNHIDFICADICHLPFRNNSVDVAVFASVFEYIEKLEDAIKQTKDVLKKDGKLVAGYPIETRLLKVLIRLFDKEAVKIWDSHKTVGNEQIKRNPHTHKHRFETIRAILEKYFLPTWRAKIPCAYFPDFMSFYECVKLVKRAAREG